MKKKILFVVPSLTQTNGIPSFLVNYIKNIDLKKFEITILSSNLRPSINYIEFFKKNNIDYYFTNDLRRDGLKKYYQSLKKFFKEHHAFDLVYSNVANQSAFIFYLAKKFGITKFAIHSHATMSSSNRIRKIINNILTNVVIHQTKNYFACSELAGKYMFKNRKFIVINNAIAYSIFKFSMQNRDEIRKQYHFDENDIIIGYVGRFAAQKNIYFFIDFMKKCDNQYKLMMIGDGPLKNSFIEKCIDNKLIDRIIFVDECSDIYKYYSCFDLFILPSNFEGLPIVAIEAQVNGLKCFLSNTITKEAKILDETTYFDRNNVEKCCKLIEEDNKFKEMHFVEKKLDDKFNILAQGKKFESILIDLCE